MKHSTTFRLAVTVILLLAALGCNLTDTIGGENADTEPTAPAVVYVTATSQPTLPVTATPSATLTPTPTPEPARLTVLPCPDYPKDCPAAISATRFYEIKAPYEYTFDVPSEIQLFVSTGWNTIDKATLEQNLPYVDFFLEIDGVDYYSDMYKSIIEKSDPDVPTRMNGYLYLNVVITGWVPHVAHTIRIGYEVTAPINDGWDDYEKGFDVEKILHVCPDGGCPVTSASSTGEPGFTACPVAADCPDATNIFQFVDFTQEFTGEEIRVEVPYDQPLLLQTGFYVTDRSYLAPSLPFLDFYFEVDGVDRFNESMLGVDTIVDILDPSLNMVGNTIGVVLEGLELGKEYHVRLGYVTTGDIFDGRETWKAGASMPLHFLIVPVE